MEHHPLEIVARAEARGVGRMITISTHLSRIICVKSVSETYENVYFTVGTHPHHSHEEAEPTVEDLVQLSCHPKCVGLGEAGLDYHYDQAPREISRRVFLTHIAAARQTGLPLVIHTRDADDDTISIIKKYYKKTNFLIHCFTGNLEFAKNLLNLNCLISFSGIITFKKSNDLRDVVKYVPLEKMLIETDSPYLSPDPFRGKSNEPANVKIVAETVASIKQISFEQVAISTTANFNNFFLYGKN